VTRRVDTLVWFGLVAAPVAWTAQHALSFGVSEAHCDPTGRQWGIPLTTWLTSLTVAAGLIVLAGLAASVLAYRQVQEAGEDDDPPAGRARLMAVFGIAIAPIFLALVLLDGIGSLLLDTCRQG
jgi:heme/copper-type cytochrome/quinol oxidase subunit 2